MIAVDTNVVVRLLVADDTAQARRAHALFEHNTIWIATTVILETEWVLRGAYKFSADEIQGALNKLFGLPHVTLGDQALIVQAVAARRRPAHGEKHLLVDLDVLI